MPLNWKADVRDDHAPGPCTRDSALISSSAMPSQKYSWSGSLVRLAKGSTAIAGSRVTGGVVSAMPLISRAQIAEQVGDALIASAGLARGGACDDAIEVRRGAADGGHRCC